MIKQDGDWDIPSATSAYNIDRWGAGYFSINPQGNCQVTPLQNQGAAIDVMAVVQEAREQGHGFPLVIRFQDLLRHRVQTICKAFASAIAESGYQKPYRGVFPIKVNQLREVVEEILDAGGGVSLRAGVRQQAGTLRGAGRAPRPGKPVIICNGYKDAVFIQNALMGRKLGKQIIMVVEKIEELRQIVEISKEMGVEPLVGSARALAEQGRGQVGDQRRGEREVRAYPRRRLVWGERITSRHRAWAHCLKLVHFHVGSQVPDIGTIKRAVREAARFYAKLLKMGHETRLHGRGRRPGGRLRRIAHGVRLQHELHAPGVRARHRLQHHGRVRLRRKSRTRSSSARAGGRWWRIIRCWSSRRSARSKRTAARVTPVEVTDKDAKLVQDIAETHRGLSAREPAGSAARRAAIQGTGPGDVRPRAAGPRNQGQGRAYLLADRAQLSCAFFEGMRYIPEEVRELVQQHSPTSTSATSACSSRCWTIGRWVSLFPIMPIHRLNESAGTQRDAGGHHLRLGRQDQQVHRPAGREGQRCRCTNCGPASRTTWGCSSSARIRTSWATCTTSSGA